ncbi:MliC family protein [Aliiroseovarius sp. S1339]|uniref:MliC family protein n=1 Tax=Aliiroseovarius sp. S1339 TaxID=2936990 RepID=UPI0020BE9DE8|nr:MliC family protein [Aliiroseovarius sp. S1339]MCK8464822.1 MliC family protein [Aliiroseovarius sp. S1339]
MILNVRNACALCACLVMSASAFPAWSSDSLQTVHYACERGAIVAATYVNSADASFAVVSVEGQQVGLTQIQSASGAKYTQDADGVGYIWWTKGDEAFLTWGNAQSGEDETLLSQCKAR